MLKIFSITKPIQCLAKGTIDFLLDLDENRKTHKEMLDKYTPNIIAFLKYLTNNATLAISDNKILLLDRELDCSELNKDFQNILMEALVRWVDKSLKKNRQELT